MTRAFPDLERPASADRAVRMNKGARHHLLAAEEFERAAGHHREAARLCAAGDDGPALRQAEAASARAQLALRHGGEAEKFRETQLLIESRARVESPRSRISPLRNA